MYFFILRVKTNLSKQKYEKIYVLEFRRTVYHVMTEGHFTWWS